MASPVIRLGTFYSDDMTRSAQLCCESAKNNDVNQAWGMTPAQLRELGIYAENKAVFDTPRGCGLWAWKPLVVLGLMDTARGVNDGDYAVWSDAGIEFINNVSHIIERMDQDIFLFGNNWEHAHWCKRDVIEAVWPFYERGRLLRGADARMIDNRTVNVFVGGESEQREVNLLELAWERFHKQVQASVIFFRVSDYTRAFVAEWLKWCLFEGGRLIDDSPSRLPNHPEFREHRHDQAILTTMAYREGLRLHYWPAVYNKGGSPEFVYEKLPEYAGDNYPVIVHHHRRRDHEWG